MTYDVLSSATTVGHQKAHLSLLNSNISKLIHDQGKSFAQRTLTGFVFLRGVLWNLYYGIITRRRLPRDLICIRVEDFIY